SRGKRMGRLWQARWISRSVGPIARPDRRGGPRLQASLVSTRGESTLQCVAILPQSFAGQNPCFDGKERIDSHDRFYMSFMLGKRESLRRATCAEQWTIGRFLGYA